MAGKQSDRIINLIVQGSTKSVQKMILDIHADLQEQTPVDTGWAASNWLPSVGIPIEDPAGTRESVQENAASVGLEGVLRWNIESGLPIFVVNNVPYISALNAGSSKQAAARFVDKIIQHRVAEANRRPIIGGR